MKFIPYCQLVLPTVYDDSLSYYECLCKLTKTVNNVIDGMNELDKGYSELKAEFAKLSDYVNNYFSNLDIQAEINNKLDGMAESGELSNILNSYISFKFLTMSGDTRISCNAIVLSNGDFILFDFGDVATADIIVSYLKSQGAKNMLCAVLSHFDADHTGDYSLIINEFKTSSTVLITQTRPLSPAIDGLKNAWDTLKDWCENNNVRFITGVDTYVAGDVKLSFYNVDSTWVYTSQPFIYNNSSLCCIASYLGTNVGIYGDLYYEGEKHIYPDITNVHVFVAPHHALGANYYEPFVVKSDPKCIIANFGLNNAYTPTIPYSSVFQNYADRYGIPWYNTTDNGSFTITCQPNGNFTTTAKPYVLNQSIRREPSFRNALSTTNFSVSAQISFKDLLLNMPPNTELSCVIYNNYQIFNELGLLGGGALLNVTKIVGGSTNYLVNRETADAFVCLVSVKNYYELADTYYTVIRYDGENFTIGTNNPGIAYIYCSKVNDTYNCSFNNNTTAGAGILEIENGNVNITRSAYYKITPYTTAPSTNSATVGSLNINFENPYPRIIYIPAGPLAISSNSAQNFGLIIEYLLVKNIEWKTALN